jgi:hypothetical protein
MSKLTGDIRAEHRDFFSEYLEDILYAFAKPQCGRNSQYLDKVSFPAVKVPVSEVEPCGMLWNRWHLTYEGYLTCCCVDYELDLVYADIKLQKPAKAWNNELMQKMRQKHLTKQLEGIICYNCLTGEDSSYHPISDIGAEVRNRKDSSVHKLDRYLGRLSKIYDTTQLDPTANI